MGKILFADFETRSIVDLREQGADVYARHESTQVMAFGYAFDEDEVRVSPLGEAPPIEVVEHVRNGGVLVGHNVAFEWLIWNNSWRRTFSSLPPLNINQCVCTMARAYAMGLPGSLEKASAALGINEEKDLKGGRIMLQLSKPKETAPNGATVWWDDADKFERMYSYCSQDVKVEREIYKRTLPLSGSEREMWELDHCINQRGVRVDISSANQAANIVAFEGERLNAELRKVTNNQVATTQANAQLLAWIKSKNILVDGVAKSDVTALLEKEVPNDVRRALTIRQEAAKSSTAKFKSLINRTSNDKRLRSTLQYHGASTGRWAGRGFQLHNLPRPKLSQREIEGVFGVLQS